MKKLNGIKTYFLLWLLAFLPLPIFAFSLSGGGESFQSFILYVIGIINPIFYILYLLALIIFFYGLIKFVIRADGDAEMKKGKEYMIGGILALFILVSFSTILGLLSGEFEFTGFNIKKPPLLKTDVPTPNVNSSVNYDNVPSQ